MANDQIDNDQVEHGLSMQKKETTTTTIFVTKFTSMWEVSFKQMYVNLDERWCSSSFVISFSVSTIAWTKLDVLTRNLIRFVAQYS